MTYVAHASDFVPDFRAEASAGSNPVAHKAGVLRRIFDAVIESRQSQTDRAIARFLARSGGRLTDDIEREMTQRLLTGDWSARQ